MQLNERLKKPFREIMVGLMNVQGVSYGELAKRTELSKTYLNNIGLGKADPPAIEATEKIARVLHVEPTIFPEYRIKKAVDAVSRSLRLAELVLDELERRPLKESKAAPGRQKKKLASGQ